MCKSVALTMHLYARCMRQHAQVLKEPCLDLVNVVGGVLVGHVGWTDVQLEVRPVVLKVVIVWQLYTSHHITSLLVTLHHRQKKIFT